MADKLNVSRQSYINYENGDTEPSFDTLKNISRILNTSIDDLLGNSLFFENNDTTVDNIINDLNIIIQKYKK
ncbi:MAG: helix-turn-helix transcriptional regulator [Erysipelotrichaceae bacterium]|nr:helix-turn-helix transcriptional regulator [Erysipelotrichaceae bacterium]